MRWNCKRLLSHPAGVRGLKYKRQVQAALTRQSHPYGVRGLKFEDVDRLHMLLRSHPCWVRGLKYVMVLLRPG